MLSKVSICKSNIRYFLMREYIICIHLKFDVLFTRVFCTKYPRYQNANDPFQCKWIFPNKKKESNMLILQISKSQDLDITIYKKNVDLLRYINLMFIRFDKKDNIQFYHININIFKLGVTGVYWLILFLVKHKTSRNQKIHTLRKISKILCQKTPLTTRNIDTRRKCKRPCIKAFS